MLLGCVTSQGTRFLEALATESADEGLNVDAVFFVFNCFEQFGEMEPVE